MNTKSSETKGKKDSERGGFTGWFIPVEIVVLFEQEKITALEILLLMKIHGLCGLENGCFASNTFFGEFLGLSARSISRMITKLKSIGLVFVLEFDGRQRKLETVWSKTGKDILHRNNALKSRQKRQNCRSKDDKNGVAAPPNLSTIEYKSIEELEKNTMSTQKSADVECEVSGNSKHKVPGKKKNNKPTKWDISGARKLEQIVSSHINVNCKSNILEWANQIRLMREKDKIPKDKIKETLVWYQHNIGDEYIPEAFSGKTFREKFKQGKFASAMKRTAKPQKEEWHDKELEYYDKTSGKWYKREILQEYMSKYQKAHGPLKKVNQEDLDAILIENGMNSGELTASAVSSG